MAPRWLRGTHPPTTVATSASASKSEPWLDVEATASLLTPRMPHARGLLFRVCASAQALDRGMSVLLEKTLFNLDGVINYAKQFAERGCRCHLLGTHIQPRRNWAFLETRMSSGQAFGRYISKEQALAGLVRYQENLERILDEPELRETFETIHVYDVESSGWCISLDVGAPPNADAEKQPAERATGE